MVIGNGIKNNKLTYFTTPKKRIHDRKKWKEMSIIRKKAKQFADQHIKKDNKCALCNYCFKLAFHHINYERNIGFTVCSSCHKRYCKEGRSFEDSLRLYEEREQRHTISLSPKSICRFP